MQFLLTFRTVTQCTCKADLTTFPFVNKPLHCDAEFQLHVTLLPCDALMMHSCAFDTLSIHDPSISIERSETERFPHNSHMPHCQAHKYTMFTNASPLPLLPMCKADPKTISLCKHAIARGISTSCDPPLLVTRHTCVCLMHHCGRVG